MTKTIDKVSYITNEALKIIGVYSEDRNEPGFRAGEALNVLNTFINSLENTGAAIPYFQVVTFNLEAGKKQYVFSKQSGADVNSNKIINLSHVCLTRDNLEVPCAIDDDTFEYGRWRNVTFKGWPYKVYLQNTHTTSTLNFIPIPDFNYQCTVKAKFKIDPVAMSDVLTELGDQYTLFLIYGVARLLKNLYKNSSWDDYKENMYQELLEEVMASSDRNLNVQTDSGLKRGRYYYYYPSFNR